MTHRVFSLVNARAPSSTPPHPTPSTHPILSQSSIPNSTPTFTTTTPTMAARPPTAATMNPPGHQHHHQHHHPHPHPHPPPQSDTTTTRLSTVPSSVKTRHHSHLHAQLAQLQAHLADLENLLRMTAVQAEYVRGLGGYAAGLYVSPLPLSLSLCLFLFSSVVGLWKVCSKSGGLGKWKGTSD